MMSFKLILNKIGKIFFNYILKFFSFFIPFTFEKRLINRLNYKTNFEKIIYLLWGVLGITILINLLTIFLGVYYTYLLIDFYENITISFLIRFLIFLFCFNLYFFLIKSIESPVKYFNNHYFLKLDFVLLIGKSLLKFILGSFFLFYCSVIFTYNIKKNEITPLINNIKKEKIIINDITINNQTIKKIKTLFNKNLNNCLEINSEEICFQESTYNKKNIDLIIKKLNHNKSNFNKLKVIVESDFQNRGMYINNELSKILEENSEQEIYFHKVINDSNFFNYKVDLAYNTILFKFIFLLNVLCLILSIFLKSTLIFIDNKYRKVKTKDINSKLRGYLNQ